jgi:hypothetical protein
VPYYQWFNGIVLVLWWQKKMLFQVASCRCFLTCKYVQILFILLVVTMFLIMHCVNCVKLIASSIVGIERRFCFANEIVYTQSCAQNKYWVNIVFCLMWTLQCCHQILESYGSFAWSMELWVGTHWYKILCLGSWWH